MTNRCHQRLQLVFGVTLQHAFYLSPNLRRRVSERLAYVRDYRKLGIIFEGDFVQDQAGGKGADRAARR